MIRIALMISLFLSVLAAAVAAAVTVQAFRLLALARERTRRRKGIPVEGGKDG